MSKAASKTTAKAKAVGLKSSASAQRKATADYLKPLPKIVLIGESHAAALENAVKYGKDNERFKPFAVYSFRKAKGDVEIGNITREEFLDLAATLTEDDIVVSAVGGNQYAVISTVRNIIDFDVLTGPDDRDIGSDDAVLVPHRALKGLLAKGVGASLGRFLKDLRKATPAHIIHLSAPPPKADNKFIAEHFEKRFSALGITEYGPSRPSLRLKCWKIQNQIVEDLCAQNDVIFFKPPQRALTSDGFLASNYYANDATHGNRRYGRDSLVQILQYAHARLGNVKAHYLNEAIAGNIHSEKRYDPTTIASDEKPS